MAKSNALYDNPRSEGVPDEQKIAESAPDEPMTFARWMQATDAVRKASGVKRPSKNELYQKWLDLQQQKDKGG
jgi:hypothetical protein